MGMALYNTIMRKYVIIGAGIIGASLARELLLNKRGNVIILEKENEAGLHASGRNSGVIHSGINQKPGTLKAKMCVEGSKMLRSYCKDKGVPFEQKGTIVTAIKDNDIGVLNELKKMGDASGVPGLRFLDTSEIKELEPNALGIKALYSPTGAIVDSKALVNRVIKDVNELGGKIYFNEKVQNIRGNKVISSGKITEFDYLVNAAGLYSDKIAGMMGIGGKYHLFPFRGEYMEIENLKINSMIYQAPDLRFPFLSVHLTKTTNGKVLAGPTAILSPGRESYNKEINIRESVEIIKEASFYKMLFKRDFLIMAQDALKMSLSKKVFKKETEKLVGPLEDRDIKPYRSGIRAQMVDRSGNFVNDIVIEETTNSLHVLNCVSPGMTCSLAFAKYLNKLIK